MSLPASHVAPPLAVQPVADQPAPDQPLADQPAPDLTSRVTPAPEDRSTGDGLATYRRIAAAASTAVGTLLYGAGAALSPDQDGQSATAYVESLARDPLQSDLSAAFLHWGWVLLVPGLIAAMTLVRGRRGRLLTAVGGTVGVLGAINLSGLVLSDFFNAHGPSVIGTAQTVAVFEQAISSPGLTLWSLVGRGGAALAIPVLFLGLARARVIGWWAAPLFLLGGVAPYVVPGPWAVLAVAVTSLPGLVLALVILRSSAGASAAAGRS